MGSEISAEEFQAALESFGLGKDKDTVHKLFNYYDWRRKRSIPFQVRHDYFHVSFPLLLSQILPRSLSTASIVGLRKERQIRFYPWGA